MSDLAPLRVLSFTTLFPNPVQPLHGLFVKNRLERMARYCDLTVVAPVNIARHPGLFRRLPRHEHLNGLSVYRPCFLVVPGVLKHWDGRLLFRQTFGQLRRVIQWERYNIVDVHYAYPDGVAGGYLAEAIGRPFVVSLRGSDVNTLARYPSRRRLIQRMLRRAAGIVAVSRALGKRAEGLGADPAKIHVIPNGVDTRLFRPVHAAEARRALGWPADARVVLSVGRLSQVKGFDLLLEALKALRERLVDRPLRCYIAGEGELRGHLDKQIRRLRLEDEVVLAGVVPPARLPLWYSAADLFCLLSRSEGCPNVLLEALACGTPVVATAVGGIPDLIHEGLDGLLVRSRHAADVATQMEKALRTDWDRETIATSTAVRDWSEVARAQIQLLQTLAAHA